MTGRAGPAGRLIGGGPGEGQGDAERAAHVGRRVGRGDRRYPAGAGVAGAGGRLAIHPVSDLVFHGSVPVARWYGERPSLHAGPRTYRGHVHARPCPHRLCGYPLPIYKARERAVSAYRVRVSAHVEWCAARYRSYDVRTDTYQPYDGPRRVCRSPVR